MKKKDIIKLQNGDWVIEKSTGKKYQVDGQEGTNWGVFNIHLKDYPYLGFQDHKKFNLDSQTKQEGELKK